MKNNEHIWDESKPSRLNVAFVYSKRIVRWRRNSLPFLTGDLFADMADINVYPPRFRGTMPDIHRIREAKVIFCPSHKLQTFLDEFGSEINAKVLLAGNSDHEFHTLPVDIPRSVRHLFLQNSFISDFSLVSTLPIGIENIRWGVNGHPNLMKKKKSWSNRQNKVLVGPFGLTHPDRVTLPKVFEGNEDIFLVKERMSPKSYSLLMNDFRYVAAVRGNGVDTHRFWESLYRGAIPIVGSNSWSTSLHNLNLPFIEIDEWSPESFHNVIANTPRTEFYPAKIEELWWPYWKRKIGSYL